MGDASQCSQFLSGFFAQAAKSTRAWEPSPPTDLRPPLRGCCKQKGGGKERKTQQVNTQQLLRRARQGRSERGCGSGAPERQLLRRGR